MCKITKENDSLQRQTENKDEDSQKIQGNKNIPELRFPEFEGEWKEVQIKDIANIVGGGTPSTKNKDFWNGKINWFTPTEVGENKYLFNSERKITEKGLEKSSATLLPINTILLTTRATIGRRSIILKKSTTNQGFQSLTIKNNSNVEFIYYLLDTLKKILLRKSCGSTFLELSKKELKKINIIIPIIEEQEKIANFLSAIDKKIGFMEKTNKNYQRVLKYYIHKLLEIGDKEHNQLIQIKDCIIESKEKNLNGLNLPIISSTLDGIFLQSDYFDNDSVAIDVTKYKIIPRNYFTYRSMSDTGIFKFNIQNLYERALVSSAYPVFKVKSEINSDYFKYYLNYSNMMKKQLYINKEGGTRYALSISKFKKMNIILPSSKVQTKISNVINSLNKKYEINNKKLHYLKQFKKGLLQKMFC